MEEKEFMDEITCPYCNYEFSDSWEFCVGGDSQKNVECLGCEKKFNLEINFETTYSTYPIKPKKENGNE